MRLSARFRLQTFPDDTQLWKIDWFGDLLPNPNARSEPLLEIFIVPFRDAEITQQRLKEKGSYNYDRIRKIKVGISLLPFLHSGTFWCGGIHQTAVLSERVILRDLQIDSENTRIINAKNFTASKELLTIFPSINSCLETNLLEIDFPNNPRKKILIPSYEIIRFYFTGSSALTRGIITGGIRARQNALFDPTQTNVDEASGIGNLILRNKLTGTDRHTVARMAFSETAANAAWGIYSSIVKNLNNNSRGIVEAKFPFVGETNLQVCGKWFKQGEIWHLLVYFIESCTHPLPYKKLIWGIEDETEVYQTTEGSKKEHWIIRTINENQEDRNVGSSEEPSLQQIFNEALFDGRKFTDLDNKDKEERLGAEKTENGIRYRIITERTDKTRELSTGEGTFGASETQGLKIKISEREEPNEQDAEKFKRLPAGWELFTSILTELEKHSSIKTRILTFDINHSSEATTQSEGIYFPHTVSGKRMNWAFLDKQQTHRRQAMLAEIEKDNKIFYLFDTEVNVENQNDRYSMLLIKNEHYNVLDMPFWKQIFSDCVKNRGVKRDLWLWENSKRLNIRHDLKEITKYAFKVKDFLKQ